MKKIGWEEESRETCGSSIVARNIRKIDCYKINNKSFSFSLSLKSIFFFFFFLYIYTNKFHPDPSMKLLKKIIDRK